MLVRVVLSFLLSEVCLSVDSFGGVQVRSGFLKRFLGGVQVSGETVQGPKKRGSLLHFTSFVHNQISHHLHTKVVINVYLFTLNALLILYLLVDRGEPPLCNGWWLGLKASYAGWFHEASGGSLWNYSFLSYFCWVGQLVWRKHPRKHNFDSSLRTAGSILQVLWKWARLLEFSWHRWNFWDE